MGSSTWRGITAACLERKNLWQPFSLLPSIEKGLAALPTTLNPAEDSGCPTSPRYLGPVAEEIPAVEKHKTCTCYIFKNI